MEKQQMEAAFRVSNLIINYLKGNLTAQEQLTLENWIAAIEENKAVFEMLTNPELAHELLSRFSTINKRKRFAYKRLQRKLFPVRKLTARLWRYVA